MITSKARDFSRKQEFTFEIIAHYPFLLRPNRGTFHVYWEEMDLDLRGIFYNDEKKSAPWIRLPSRKGMIEEEECSFPFYSFPNSQKSGRFMKSLREAFSIYMKEK